MITAGGSGLDSYLAIKVKDHPNAWPNGYIYYHRWLVEQSLGRYLEDDEIVHHVDENKRNNDLANLEVLSREEHARLHGLERGMAYARLICAQCGVEFEREVRKIRSVKSFCDSSCRGKFYLPRKKRTAVHGSASKYNYQKCRCDICKRGQKLRARNRSARLAQRKEQLASNEKVEGSTPSSSAKSS